MPTFDTPEPIQVRLDLSRGVGAVRLVAGDRTDTVVEVRPSDTARNADVKAAGDTTVAFTDGQLTIRAPKDTNFFGRGGSVDITVWLPTDSQVEGDSAHGGYGSEGRLGECKLTTHYGHLDLDETGPLVAHTGAGKIVVDHASGQVDVKTRIGAIRLGTVDGAVTIQTNRGATWVGDVVGELRVNAKGDVTVERAHAGVEVRSTVGDIRLGEVRAAEVEVTTGDGDIEVGIRDGVALWFDAHTSAGTVTNKLTGTDTPPPSDNTVKVRARTHRGDILIRRADLEA